MKESQIDLRQTISKGYKFMLQLKANPRIDPFLELQQISQNGLMDFKFVNRKIVKFSSMQLNFKENKYSDLSQLVSDFRAIFQAVSNYVPLNDPLQLEVKYFQAEIDKFKNICQVGGSIQGMGSLDEQQQQTLKTRSNVIGGISSSIAIPNDNTNNNPNSNTNAQKASSSNNKPFPSQQAPPNQSSFNNNNQHHSPHQHYNPYNKDRKYYERQRETKITNWAKIQSQNNKQQAMPTVKAYKLPVRSTLAQKLEMIYYLKAHETNQPFIHTIGHRHNIGYQTEQEYVIKLDNSTNCTWLDVLQNADNQD